MPMSKNEILSVQALIHESINDGTIDEVINNAKNTLGLYQLEMMTGHGTTVSNKEL